MKFESAEDLAAKTEGPSSNDITIATNPNGKITKWNKKAEKIFGYSAKEALNQNISMLFSGKNQGKENEYLQEVRAGKAKQYEIACKAKSGKKLSVAFSAFPEYENSGEVTSICQIAYDMTNKEDVEEKESVLYSIIDSSDNAIISKNVKGIITSWNPAATKLFGYTEDEAVGKSITIIFPKDGFEEEDLIIENIRKGQKIENFETIRCAKDGTEKPVLLTVYPIKNKSGKITGGVKIIKDVSQKDREDEKQATLAAIVSSSDDAIISKDLKGIITSWNHSAEEMFGYTEKEAIGKHISLIIPKERLPEEDRIIGSIRRGEKIDHFETERIAKDGTRRQLSITVSPIKNSRGKIIGASKVARDISLRLEAERQQALYTERLQELNKYKDEFMVMASHELKTPLTVIMANLQLLQELLQKDKNVVFIEKAAKQVHKLAELVTNLLDVSKIQAGKLAMNPTEFDLNELLSESLGNLQQTTKTQKIIYNGNGNKLMIRADRERIEQVITNIIGNAIKYSRSPGDIIVKAAKKDGNINVTVTDKGIGIPKKDIENIFLRFYRVSGSASSFSGSGVGLYISAEIIKSHGGKIWAESKVGKGSVFHFSLPALSTK
ncbi:MAG TPA: PAS domain S-box protein [Hanamia sp.]|nr:PAS domain S-box protein [Hanamia sp.]